MEATPSSPDEPRKGANATIPPSMRPETSVDVEVYVWSANVLPSDPSGFYRPIAFNDPHKYQFCKFLATSKEIESVTIVCPGISGEREPNPRHDDPRILRVIVPLSDVSSAVLWFNLRAAWHVLGSEWHISYFFDDGKAIPFVLPLLLSRIRGFPVVLDYRNPPVFHRAADVHNLRQWLLLRAERFAYKLSSLVIALSPSCSRILSESYGGAPWVVQSTVSPTFQRPPAVALGPRGLIRFVYWGSISKARRLEELVSGFIDACHQDPNTPRELVLVGEGDDKAPLEALVRREGRVRVLFYPWQTQEALQRILSMATVAVVAIPADIEQYVASSPLKLVEALALGRPILASELPATSIVSETQIGIQAKHERRSYANAFLAFDQESLGQFVAALRENPDLATANLPAAVFPPIVEWLASHRNPRTDSRTGGS